MLFGLLGVYIINLRHFTRQLDSAFWLSLVSFLNMGACALNLATLTTRFVFPQFSLEGRRVWLVGLAPIGLVRVVRLKFWLASVTTLAVTLGLVLLSCSMLGLDAAHTVFFGLSVTVMTFTLNAIAVGLGALYPNLRETNPNKIVSGFGGTFCLVLSFVYILVSVVLLAVSSPWGWKPDMTDQFAPARAASTWVAFVLVSFLAGWFPLRLGLRKVATAEL
jgi:ABC-2 type transport system permease protein